MPAQKITPELIEEWGKKHPGAIKKLVAEYGLMCYKQAIKDLEYISTDLRQIETNTAVFVCPLNQYDDWKRADTYQGKFDAMRSPEGSERFQRIAPQDLVSTCCGAAKPSSEFYSETCPKCKEHCGYVETE